jgi:hypothetical protein
VSAQLPGRWLRRRFASLSLAPRARELERARKTADAELAQASTPPPRLAWRTAELTDGARRLRLADQLRRLVDAAGHPREKEPMLAVAARLGDLTRPVAPRGVLMLERLLRDNDRPRLAGELAAITRALELS